MEEIRADVFDVVVNAEGEVMVSFPILPGRPAKPSASLDGGDLVLRRDQDRAVRFPGLTEGNLDSLARARSVLFVEADGVPGAPPARTGGAALIEYTVALAGA